MRFLGLKSLNKLQVIIYLILSSTVLSWADDTWRGTNSTSFSTGANWLDNSAPSTTDGGDLTFSTATRYTVLLNQGDNKNAQTVDVFDVIGGTTSYTFTRTSTYSYIILGRSKTDGDSIVNTSGNRVTFNVPIEQSAQNGSSFANNLWKAGTGGLTFNETVSFASNSKDVLVSGSGAVNLNAGASVANYTGSSAILYATTGATVNISGTVGVTSANAGMHGIGVRGGTLLLSGTGGGDLIQDSDNNARGTRLQLEGGTFGYTAADSNIRLAEFYRSMTASVNSTVQFGDETGGGIIAFIDSNSTGGTINPGVTLNMDNWNGTQYTGGGTDQFVFSSLYNNGVLVSPYQNLNNIFVEINNVYYYGFSVPSPTYPGFIEIVAGNPVLPEPSTYAAGFALLCGIACVEWRRRRIHLKPLLAAHA